MGREFASLYATLAIDASGFKKGMKDSADALTRLGGDFTKVSGSLDSLISQYKASTPENLKYAQSIAKIQTAFDNGNISSAEAVKQLQAVKREMGSGVSPINKFKTGFQDLTGISLTGAGAIAAAGLAIKEVSKAINETVDYNSQIKDTARLLGLTTEETSRLVQAADDLFVSEDTLKTAFQAASRQGIDVSITGIKSLSEQYLELNPGVERAQFLMKAFGRSGADMGKLMEVGADGIDKAMGAIGDSLVVTQKSIEQSDEYKRNLDNLSDSWTGLKIAVGNGVIPVLNAFLSTEQDADEIMQQNIKTQLEAIKQAKARGVATQELLDLEQKLLNLENSTRVNQAWTDNLNAQADAYFRLHPEVKQVTDDIKLFEDTLKEAALTTDLETSFMNAKDATDQFDLGLKMIRTGLQEFGKAGEETFQSILLGIGDISPAAVTAYIEMQTVVGNIKKMMEAGFSTQVIVDYVINVKSGGGTGIPVVGGAAGEFYGGSTAPKPKGNAGKSYIDANGLHWQQNLNPDGSEKGWTHSNANGGSWMIPMAFGNEGYIMPGGQSASGGETVTVTPKNQQGMTAEEYRTAMKEQAKIFGNQMALKLAELGVLR